MTALSARLSLVTLGVTELVRATAFYRAPGWPLSSASTDGVSFFGTAAAILALYPSDELCVDAGRDPVAMPAGYRGIALAINLDSNTDVDEAVALAAAGGGTVLKAPRPTDWGGYSGYFRRSGWARVGGSAQSGLAYRPRRTTTAAVNPTVLTADAPCIRDTGGIRLAPTGMPSAVKPARSQGGSGVSVS